MKKILAMLLFAGAVQAADVVLYSATPVEPDYPAMVPKTGQTTSYADYDDGWYGTNVGVAMPSPRFTALSNTNAIRDNLTGLVWAKNAAIWSDTNDWSAAITRCEALDYAGYTDWRLPNLMELQSLTAGGFANINPRLPTGHPFANIQYSNKRYHSATTRAATASTDAFRMDFAQAIIATYTKSTTSTMFIWPVRGPD